MSRPRARHTEADIRRATKVAKEMNMAVDLLPDGTIKIVPPPPQQDCPLPEKSGKWTPRPMA